MPNVSAIVKEPFALPPHDYAVGDLFVQPDWYEDKFVVKIWLLGKIGDFDTSLLEPEQRELIEDPEWCAIMRHSLTCAGCRG